MDWNSIAKLSQEAFRVAVNEWIGAARIQGGNVRGPSATLPPGSLVSDTNIEARVFQSLTASKVPNEISSALAKVLAGAWNDWAKGFQIQLPSAYPSFAAIPGPYAPPTRAQPASVSQGNSIGESSLKASMLTSKLSAAVQARPTRAVAGGPGPAMQNLAAWVESSFNDWKSLTKMVGMVGKGPVATYAPPYVPVGPVVSGENLSTGSLFSGPRFGKVII